MKASQALETYHYSGKKEDYELRHELIKAITEAAADGNRFVLLGRHKWEPKDLVVLQDLGYKITALPRWHFWIKEMSTTIMVSW